MHIQESLMHTLIMEFMGEGRYIGENESEVCEREWEIWYLQVESWKVKKGYVEKKNGCEI